MMSYSVRQLVKKSASLNLRLSLPLFWSLCLHECASPLSDPSSLGLLGYKYGSRSLLRIFVLLLPAS